MGQFSTLEVKMIAGFGLIWMFTSKLKFRVQFQHLTSAVVTTEGLFWQVLQEFYLADLVQHLSKLTHHTPGYSGWITSGTRFSLRDLFTSVFSVLEGLLLLHLYFSVLYVHAFPWAYACAHVEADTLLPSIACHHFFLTGPLTEPRTCAIS